MVVDIDLRVYIIINIIKIILFSFLVRMNNSNNSSLNLNPISNIDILKKSKDTLSLLLIQNIYHLLALEVSSSK